MSDACSIRWSKFFRIWNIKFKFWCYRLKLITWTIYFSINGLFTENRLRSQRTPTPHKIKVKKCKLIDLVIRSELTQAILMPRFSNFQINLIIHFRMFLYLGIGFLRVTVSLLCRLQAVSKLHVPIYPCLISEGRWNCSSLWPAQQQNSDSQDTCYQYKNMQT